jgi:hypothetical protein
MFHKNDDLPKNRLTWFGRHKYGTANPVTVLLEEGKAKRVTYVIAVYGKLSRTSLATPR